MGAGEKGTTEFCTTPVLLLRAERQSTKHGTRKTPQLSLHHPKRRIELNPDYEKDVFPQRT